MWKFLLTLIVIIGIIIAILGFARNTQTVSNTALNSKSAPTGQVLAEQKINRKIIGFTPSWMQPSNVSFPYLDEIIFSGIDLNENGTLTGTNRLSSSSFTTLRNSIGKNTKVVVSIRNFDSDSLSAFLQDSDAMDQATEETLQLIETYHLDGINIDFEYPTSTDTTIGKNLSIFLKNYSGIIKAHYPDAIVSFDIHAIQILDEDMYQLEEIGKYMDEVIIMGYDYRLPGSLRAGPVAPLYGEVNEHSIQELVQVALRKIPNEKLILGIPFYGYDWETVGETHKSTAKSKTGAVASYKRMKEFIANNHVSVQWDEIARSPWILYKNGNEIHQIYFENERSIEEKLSYVVSQNLGGIAIWALGYEGEDADLWNTMGKLMKNQQ